MSLPVFLGILLGASLALQVPGGTYRPFYSLEGSRRAVDVPSFRLDRYPVTNSEYLAFVRRHPEWRRSRVNPLFAERDYLKHWTGDLSFTPELANRPVVYVSWFAARAYARSVGKRLPTVDEWEYAARANETRADASRDPVFRQRILDWYSRPTSRLPPSVGTLYKNVYGQWDLHGSVWEWVDDFSSTFLSDDARNGGKLDRNLYCAAGVQASADPSDYAAYMRFAFRSSLKAAYTLKNLGFRCASDF